MYYWTLFSPEGTERRDISKLLESVEDFCEGIQLSRSFSVERLSSGNYTGFAIFKSKIAKSQLTNTFFSFWLNQSQRSFHTQFLVHSSFLLKEQLLEW